MPAAVLDKARRAGREGGRFQWVLDRLRIFLAQFTADGGRKEGWRASVCRSADMLANPPNLGKWTDQEAGLPGDAR